MSRTAFIAWNEGKTEGVVFLREKDARSALDGKHRYDAELGFKSISTLAENFHEAYGEDKCTVEAVTLPDAAS
ncbi:hypothetical protein [Mesorhizobium sp. M7A.F.Ca.MR.362.00.0.0]|uniref:hypothetical protein n=1 Tax=Mesorhizobium sp. M7A.F.Ca.MR.362.00.0.0 TaxID=2496779 RepID=UPI000FD337F4|nr:hypothetical protein [Mesorhizobium sp. M7A.F.Ca.MR.362.00.0.0]RUU79994.1 hypothetical protein EOC06_13865 [Mesorhizobium sp. M7A.F.Ca.MR.362.00.0.0]